MRSRRQVAVLPRSLGLAAFAGLTLLSVGLTNPVWAAKPGHGSVMSPAGAPLSLEIPLYELTPEDVAILKVSVAPQQAWLAAGLTSPAPLETLSVSIEPGFSAGSRRLVVRSSQAVNRPVVDVLLDVSLATGRLTVQSSYLVLVSTAPSGSVVVAPGDTLSGIAQRYAVAGADLYQMLWALYQANPNAFISQNMNLLRAGATLSIPDVQTVLAVDPKHAYAMFLKHAEAFKQGRGSANRPGQAPVVPPGPTASGTAQPPATQAELAPTVGPVPVVAPGPTASGTVQPPSNPAVPAPTVDQLRLSAATQSTAQEDAKVAAAQELKEMQQRIDALQQNVQQLRSAVQQQAEPTQHAQAGNAPSNNLSARSAASGNATTGSPRTPGTPAASAPVSQGDRPAASGMARVQQIANDNVLWVVLGASAFLAMLMALMLKRAGQRETEVDSASQNDPVIAKAFDQKLQSIDLNLDSSAADPKPVAAPEKKV
jgi:pilus assembly protein FimV